jgi:two-component system, OmpR family, sensor kinase
LRRRLILGATYLLLIVVIGLAVPFGATLSRRLTSDLGGRVEREAFAVAAAVEDQIEQRQTQTLQILVVRFAHEIGGRVLVTDGTGVLLADSLQAPGPNPPSYASPGRPEIGLALRGLPNWSVRHSSTLGYDLLVSAVPIRSAGRMLGVVRITYPMAEVRSAIHRSWWFLAAVGAITLSLGLALALWMARWATRPLKQAAGAARRMSEGDLDVRLPEQGPPEVRELARDMNEMAHHLSDLLRSNREFASNASHQLRTPLAALRLSLEEALDGQDPRGEIGHALEEADRLNETVSALLALGEVRERPTEMVSITTVVGEVLASRKDGSTPVEVQGDGRVLADPERLRQIVANLVDNAGRYARTTIRVRTHGAGDRVVVTVEDDGPGIPTDQRPRVFDRFYRGRRPVGSGSGLGLAVARELARVDGGTVEALESELGGARFDVSYPADATTPLGLGS